MIEPFGTSITDEKILKKFSPKLDCDSDLEKTLPFILHHSTSIPLEIAPKFRGDLLRKRLSKSISKIKSAPIEHYEIKLYKLTNLFYEYLGGIWFDLDFFEEAHYLVCLQRKNYDLNYSDKSLLDEMLTGISIRDPYVFQKYKLVSGMLNFCGSLLVKWKLFKIDRYDFRYNGRTLNVKVVNLESLNNSVLSLDTLWLAWGLFQEPLVRIAQPPLLEMAKLLRAAVSDIFAVLLMLNSYSPTYKIKKIVAYKSEEYRAYKSSIIPEENTENYEHQKLRYERGFLARCFHSNPVLENVYSKMIELEMIYHSFEKELIKSLLRATGFTDIRY